MGRVPVLRPRRRVPRARLPLHRRLLADPVSLRRWLLVAALAIVAAALTGSVLSSAEAERRQWGETTTVWVTTRAVAPGEVLAGATRAAIWPTALVPTGATGPVEDQTVATQSIGVGLPVTADAIGTVRDDRRHVALPVGSAPMPVAPADEVEVWATTDPSLSDSSLATRRIAADARVVSADDRAVVVSVSPDDVADVAEAAALATVTVVAVGP